MLIGILYLNEWEMIVILYLNEWEMIVILYLHEWEKSTFMITYSISDKTLEANDSSFM